MYLLMIDKNNKFNNIYADTEFYKSSEQPPTYTGNWIKQLKKVMEDHPRCEFFRVCGSTTARIPDLESCKNLTHLDLMVFLDQINKQKDL